MAKATDRLANMSRVPFGSLIMCLDDNISNCRANIELASDEEIEIFYKECLIAYQQMKVKIIKMFMAEMEWEA